MTTDSTQLTGTWSVVRVSGLLPPRVTKTIGDQHGITRWFGIAVGRFDVLRTGPDTFDLRYRRWPVRDEIRVADGAWHGAGRLPGGLRFCRFDLRR